MVSLQVPPASAVTLSERPQALPDLAIHPRGHSGRPPAPLPGHCRANPLPWPRATAGPAGPPPARLRLCLRFSLGPSPVPGAPSNISKALDRNLRDNPRCPPRPARGPGGKPVAIHILSPDTPRLLLRPFPKPSSECTPGPSRDTLAGPPGDSPERLHGPFQGIPSGRPLPEHLPWVLRTPFRTPLRATAGALPQTPSAHPHRPIRRHCPGRTAGPSPRASLGGSSQGILQRGPLPAPSPAFPPEALPGTFRRTFPRQSRKHNLWNFPQITVGTSDGASRVNPGVLCGYLPGSSGAPPECPFGWSLRAGPFPRIPVGELRCSYLKRIRGSYHENRGFRPKGPPKALRGP